MEIKDQHQLRFFGVEFINVNFSSYAKVESNKPKIDLKIEPRLFIPKEKPEFFHILMDVSINAEDYFSLSLVAVGTFAVTGENVDDKLRAEFINANAPAIMFPYVRSFVSTFTSNLGDVTGRLLIPTQFFKGNLPEIESPEDTRFLKEE